MIIFCLDGLSVLFILRKYDDGSYRKKKNFFLLLIESIFLYVHRLDNNNKVQENKEKH